MPFYLPFYLPHYLPLPALLPALTCPALAERALTHPRRVYLMFSARLKLWLKNRISVSFHYNTPATTSVAEVDAPQCL